jgi:predicted metalloprotease
MMREAPERRRELAMRFELEADCLAGVWAGLSHGIAASETVRAELLSSLTMIGDDRVQVAALGGTPDPANFWHGTSKQRSRWFVIGLEAHHAEACDVLSATSF